ncbi:MAG: ABC transporter ATP-binding protein [Pseudomonadota bacterium]
MTSVIKVEDLTRSFGRKDVLKGINLEVAPGIVYGLVGENGVGKTTLIQHLLGLLKAQRGSVRIFGFNPVTHPVDVLGRIGYLSENRDLPGFMKIDEFMTYNAAFYPRWDHQFATELAATFELNSTDSLASLSQGQRARVGLLAALAHRPSLLLLDEPSTGLDPIVRRDILSAVIRTVADEGRTVLFSSHLLDEVERVADRVGILASGKIALDGELEAIKQDHLKLVIRFAEPVHQCPRIDGALTSTGQGREWTVFWHGDANRVASAINAVGAELVEQHIPSLDDIFVARTRPTQASNEHTEGEETVI